MDDDRWTETQETSRGGSLVTFPFEAMVYSCLCRKGTIFSTSDEY